VTPIRLLRMLTPDGAPDDVHELALGLLLLRVDAIAVRAFQHQRVHAGVHLGILENAPARTSEVAAHAEPQAAAVRRELEHRERRAEDVSRVPVLDRDAVEQVPRRVVVMPVHARERLLRVARRVQRLALGPAPPVAIHVLHVSLHQERAVLQHHLREPDRGRRRVDAARVPPGDERRQVARVIEVRVRHHDRVECCRFEAERAIDRLGLVAVPLIKSAVEQPLPIAEADAVTRPGDGARRAFERDREFVRH